MNQYKYISKSYTLDELVNGNPIFKIYCDFFNDLYEWEQGQDIQQINKLELDYINTEHLELVFNEFLNILSLLIFDKVSYNETLKKVTLKSNELEKFYLLASIIPNCLDDINLLKDFKITEKTRSYIDKTYDFSLDIGQDIALLKIAVKHCENLNNILTEENINDLTNFFDIPQIEAFNEMISNYPFKHKNKEKNQKNKVLKENELTTRQKVLLIENLIVTDVWSKYSERKKAKLISYIINTNETNIRNILAISDKKPTSQSKDFTDDMALINKLT